MRVRAVSGLRVDLSPGGKGGGGGAPLFNPATLFSSGELGFWYDASDTSTMFSDTGGTIPAVSTDPVAYMLDKSGRGNHLQQTTLAARPQYIDDEGLRQLQFDGVDDFLPTLAGVNLSTTDKLTLFVASRNVLGVSGPVIGNGSGDINNFRLIYQSGTNKFEAQLRDTATTFSELVSDVGDTSQEIYTIEFDRSQLTTATQIQIRRRGVTPATIVQSEGNIIGNFGSTAITLGSWLTVRIFGSIYETIAVGRAVTTEERSGVEAYLLAQGIV